MSTATQQASRKRLTRRDYERRMWGKSHYDGGILVGSLDPRTVAEGPEARSDDERWCKRCERVRRVMQWMGTHWMRCCGAKA